MLLKRREEGASHAIPVHAKPPHEAPAHAKSSNALLHMLRTKISSKHAPTG